MNVIMQLLTSIFGLNTDQADDAHSHLEALQGDSALIRLVCELRDLKIELGHTELGQTETSAG